MRSMRFVGRNFLMEWVLSLISHPATATSQKKIPVSCNFGAFAFATRAMFLNAALALLLGLIYLGVTMADSVITVDAGDERIVLDDTFTWYDVPAGCHASIVTGTLGGTATFNFTGVGFTIFGIKDDMGGVFDIYIDSSLQERIDRYTAAPLPMCWVSLYTKAGLSYKQHEIHMVLRGNGTQGYRPHMSIDAIQYTVPDSTMISVLSSVPTSAGTATSTATSLSGGIITSKSIPKRAIIGIAVGGSLAVVFIAVGSVWIYKNRGQTTFTFRNSLPLEPIRHEPRHEPIRQAM